MEQWKEVTLGEVCNFKRGHDLTKSKMKYGKYPVVASNGIIGYHDEYTTKAPCVTIGRSGNVGTPYFYSKDCWAHNTTLYIDDFKGNNEKFVYYLLKTMDFANYQGGSAVPTLNRNHIHPIAIKTTLNNSEQKAIASILSALDDKIELNNKINKSLEEIAQAIFKSWFVDFEPFQDGEFVESELGLIPKGWRVGTLSEIANITSGKRPKNKYSNYNTEFNIPIVGASSIMGYTSEVLYCEKILVTGRVGTHGIVQRFHSLCWTSDNTLVIKSIFYEFTYQQLLNVDFVNMNRGSTQPLITQTDLKNAKIVIPCNDILQSFEGLTSSLMVQMEGNKEENEKLSQLLDTLLPKLMSGEIRVPLETH